MINFLINYTKRVFEKGKYIFFYNIVERFTFFIFYVSIVRYVDREVYGFVVSVFAFTNIIASFFDFGFPFYVQRESASGHFSIRELSQVILFKLSLIFIYVSIPIVYFFSEISDNLLIILLISIINYILPINQIFVFYLNGMERFKVNFYSIFYSRLILFILLICNAWLKLDFLISLLSMLLILFIQAVYLIKSIYGNEIYTSFNKIELESIKKILKAAIPFGLGVIFVMSYDRVDVLILKYFWTNVDVAIYSVSYSLYRNTSLISGIILFQSYNYYSKEFYRGYINYGKRIKSDLIYLMVTSLSLIVIFNFIGELIIKIFFGENYIVSSRYLKILSFAIPIVFLNNLAGVLLNSIRKEKLNMQITMHGLIVNLVLNIILIPNYRILGAVVSTILTELFILSNQYNRLRGFLKT